MLINGDVKTSWYSRNKERQKELNRQRYLSDPERERAYRRESYHKNKDKITVKQKNLWKHARHRALVKYLPFDILPEDIEIPVICPIMEVPISKGKYAPSVDRIIPELGYVKGNIRVISLLANQMKWNSTPEELETFCRGMLAFLGK